ncbi:MAG: helix-turn-helix domain-containing protein [Thermoleophilaceae bacterium]
MRLACRLRELREARELSLADVKAALPAGVKASRGDLSRIERGMMLPPQKWVSALEAAYGAPSSSWYPSPEGAVAGVVILREAVEPDEAA